MSRTLSRRRARRFYDRLGAGQDSQRFYENPATGDLAAHADFEHAHSVFELGCGTGSFAERLLAGALPPGAHYLGVDLSETMAGLAGDRLARFGPRASVIRIPGEPEVDLPEGGADRFVSNYVLDLLPGDEIRAWLAEAHRVLAPGGLLCLVSLTHGTGLLSKSVIGLWRGLHRLSPVLVGGCRPVELLDHVGAGWEVRYRRTVVAFAVPSEVLVAARV